MFKELRKLLEDMLGSAAARLFDGAGVALLSLAAILPIVQGGLSLAVNAFGGISGDVAGLLYMSGIGVALTNIGSALMVSTWMESQRALVGVRKAGGT